MKRTIRWGILGTGTIAEKFAHGLKFVKGAEIAAVGSRTAENAERFAKRHPGARAYGSYEALAADQSLDIIYIATPHTCHKANSLACLEAGRAVLCEKPFAVNAGETDTMIRCAKEKNLFLMEAMWTRFLPATIAVRKWLRAGFIGEVRMVKADFGMRTKWNPEGRLLNRNLGGGALLDVGIYGVSFASMVFGETPQEVSGFAHIGETGVDEQSTVTLGYTKGRLAVLSCAVRTLLPNDAYIIGTDGYIHIPSFWRAEKAHLYLAGKRAGTVRKRFRGSGYRYEAEEVMRCLRAGKIESSFMPHAESLELMKTLDRIRALWKLQYPGEENHAGG
jgi:dihydrodiol dehydrogenase / D-xylose 1-dehydrogenase (NADP)